MENINRYRIQVVLRNLCYRYTFILLPPPVYLDNTGQRWQTTGQRQQWTLPIEAHLGRSKLPALNKTILNCVASSPGPERKEPLMLVLSRHRDESIMIGDDIVITIVDIRGDKVRLGIDAPTDIPVHRQEVYEAIKREQANAAKAGKDESSTDSGR